MPCGDPTQLAPVRALPLYPCPYTPTEVTRPIWLAFTASAPLSTLTRQGTTALKLGFTPSLGRLSNCQATEDDWRWSQTTATMNAPTMMTPPNAPKRRKYGPHSRLRDEMETKENVVGSTLDDEERITFVPSPHSLLFTVCLHVITIDKFKLAVTTFHVARRDYLLDGGPPVRST